MKNDTELSSALQKEITEENYPIDLTDLEEFDWDSMIAPGPYTHIEKVEQDLALDLSTISHHGIACSDHLTLPVFLKENTSVNIVELQTPVSASREIIAFTSGNNTMTRILLGAEFLVIGVLLWRRARKKYENDVHEYKSLISAILES